MERYMAVAAHLQELKTKHQSLDEKIRTELKTPAPDMLRLSSLKKRKLYIKEQIQSLKA
jgi:hypothetical protein